MNDNADHDSASLSELYRLYNENKYADCLEACQEFFYDRSMKADIHGLMALCYIQIGEQDKAEFHAGKAMDLNPYSENALLASAYIDLKKDRTSTALFKYTRLINLKKEVRRTRRILSSLKSAASPGALLLRKKLQFFIPSRFSIPRSPIAKRKWKTPGILFLSLAVLSIGYFAFEKLEIPLGERGGTQGEPGDSDPLKDIYLFESIDNNSDITSIEVVEAFESVKEHIRRREINQAIVLYNRIVDSNVNLLIKEKFNILYKMIPTPNFSDLKETTPLEERIDKPFYRNTYVKLDGLLSFLPRERKEKEAIFNFTVWESGQYTRTAEVYFPKLDPLPRKDNHRYTLLAIYKGFHPRKKKIILEGIALRSWK